MADQNIRPPFDKEIIQIADYVLNYKVESKLAYDTATWCLMDSLGCALLALKYSQCTKLLGPIVPDTQVLYGARVPGTAYILDPIKAAFDIGAMVRWLDFNDTWLAAEWGHPSDNLGAILGIADYLSRKSLAEGKPSLTMHDVLTAMIQAHEIQGVLALENAFNRVGMDHVVLVKIASAAVATKLLGGNKEQICNAISLAWVDGQAMRTYRHAPNTGSRKSWAAGDATSKAVRLALMTMAGEMGYPSVLTAPKWGFYDVYMKGQPFKFQRDYGSYVMENVLFKISFPAEFHAQTAVECAIILHPQIKDKFDQIKKITIRTQESANRIINKQGPLHNYADRDHSLQYMTAIGLIFGELTADHYEDAVAKDPRIDALRDKMEVIEDMQFTKDYLDPEKRSIGNAIKIYFDDGTETEEIAIEYPIGHRRRRKEGVPVLENKFLHNLKTHFTQQRAEEIYQLMQNQEQLAALSVAEFIDKFV